MSPFPSNHRALLIAVLFSLLRLSPLAGDTLSVGLDQRGGFRHDGRTVTLPQLLSVLREAGAAESPPDVKLDIHDDAPGARVGQLLEQLHYEGLGCIDVGHAPHTVQGTGSILVRITKDGVFHVGDTRVSVDGLAGALAALPEGDGDAGVHLAFDDRTPYRALKPLFRAVAAAQVDRVVLNGRVFTLVRAAPTRQVIKVAPRWTDARQAREALAGIVENLGAHHRRLEAMRDAMFVLAKMKADPSVLTEAETAWRKAAGADQAGLTLPQLYALAQALEQDMLTLYREALCARMRAHRPDLAYLEIYETTTVPRPMRAAIDLVNLPRQEDALKETLRNLRREAQAIEVSAARLVDFVTAMTRRDPDEIIPDIGRDDQGMIEYKGPELLPDEMDFTYTPNNGAFSARGGRRLVRGLTGFDWLYLDTWYIVGPFDGDRRREQLDVRFGPEAHVHLADAFSGKNSRRITWDYKHVGAPAVPGTDRPTPRAYWKIEPDRIESYAIYYAWTEVYSDTERDVWIATGTDDYGKLWVNDELIWKSPKSRKPYNATENIQQVSLRKGHNKVLYRVENAGGTMGFSLLVRVSEAFE